MELRHLRYFIAVAEEMNFTRAAARLNIAQPPLSQQIKHLETELGTPLFLRSGRRIELTDAGRVFLERARRIVAEIEEARWSARRAGRGELGSLVIGFSASVAFELLSHAVASHRERYPAVQIDLRELGTAGQIEGLLKGELHVGLVREKVIDDRLRAEILRREPLVAVLPAGHRLAGRRTLALRDLAEDRFLLAPSAQSTSYTELVLRSSASAGFTPLVVQHPTETLTTLTLVAAGVGVTLLPASVQRLQARGVVYRRLRAPAPIIELLVAWRREPASPLIDAFLETCRRAVREMGG